MRGIILGACLVAACLAAPPVVAQILLPKPGGGGGGAPEGRPLELCRSYGAEEAKADLADTSFAGQDLTGRSFAGQVLWRVDLSGATLREADLSNALLCEVNLAGADLTGATLTGTRIGGGSDLAEARLDRISGRGLVVEDAGLDGTTFAGADLAGARLACPWEEDSISCQFAAHFPATVAGADLTGAEFQSVLLASGLETARAAGLTMEMPTDLAALAPLAKALGPRDEVTLTPAYGMTGEVTAFTGTELAQLDGVLAGLRQEARPSFDCTKAATAAEKAICADGRLALLDRALSRLWSQIPEARRDVAAQRAWARARPEETESLIFSYAERIGALAPLAQPRENLPAGVWSSDPPSVPPAGPQRALAEKLMRARGGTADYVGIGEGTVFGVSIGANGHSCSVFARAEDLVIDGMLLRIKDDSDLPPEEQLGFVFTPDVAVPVGYGRYWCGMRASWSAAYYRLDPYYQDLWGLTGEGLGDGE